MSISLCLFAQNLYWLSLDHVSNSSILSPLSFLSPYPYLPIACSHPPLSVPTFAFQSPTITFTSFLDRSKNKELVDELERIAPIRNEEDTEEEDNTLYEEVEKAVSQLKKNKSPGTDGITGEMIQTGGERMTEEIHKLCRQAWREGKIPEEWTQTILVIIPKKGDLMECSNCRTIALLNHMSRVLMNVLQE